jgi:hypothetical protein
MLACTGRFFGAGGYRNALEIGSKTTHLGNRRLGVSAGRLAPNNGINDLLRINNLYRINRIDFAVFWSNVHYRQLINKPASDAAFCHFSAGKRYLLG